MAKLQRGRHAIAQQPEVSDIRVLARADLAVLQMPRPMPALQNLRDTHHRVARAVAAGMANGEVAAVCGISYNRVTILKADPAFKELVAHYRGVITAEYAQTADPVIEYLKSNALKAAAMLSDKLDHAMENNEFLPTRDLVAIQETGFDRTGYGKVNKNINVNVDFAAQLEAARKRSAAARTIEGTAIRPSSPAPQQAPADTAPVRRVPSPPLRRI